MNEDIYQMCLAKNPAQFRAFIEGQVAASALYDETEQDKYPALLGLRRAAVIDSQAGYILGNLVQQRDRNKHCMPVRLTQTPTRCRGSED